MAGPGVPVPAEVSGLSVDSPSALRNEPIQVGSSPRVGFVVSKAVGGSVVRHRVARRLRHVLRGRLDQVPAGTRLVVRALPRSATADSARLGADVDRALRVVLAVPERRRGSERPRSGTSMNERGEGA